MKAYTDQLGKDATNQLTGELTTAKDNAVTELETYEDITTRNLKNQGDWAIEDLRESVTGLLDGLVFQFRLVRSTLIECQYFLFGNGQSEIECKTLITRRAITSYSSGW